MTSSPKKFLPDVFVSFLLSLLLIGSLYYSIAAKNYSLISLVAVLGFIILPHTSEDITWEKRQFSLLNNKALLVPLVLFAVLLLSYDLLLPNYREKLAHGYLYFWGAVTFYGILYYKEKFEALLRKYRLTNKLILLFSLLFSLYLWGGNLRANWGLTDDHMMMHYFIDNPTISLLEVPKIIIEKTEVGNFGHSTINRPFYYSGRVIESALWQRNVSLWYLARIMMFGVAFALFWILIERWLGFLYGGIFLFAVFLASYWARIWGYLGPAENYAMFGTALYAYGYVNILSWLKSTKREEKNVVASAAVLLLGSLIAVGSKENFLLLVIPLVYLAFLLFKKRIKSPSLILTLAAVFIYGAYIALGIYLGLGEAGGDVYGQSVGILDRLRLTYTNLATAFKGLLGGIVVVTLVAWAFLVRRKGTVDTARYKTIVKNFLFAALLLLALYASQVFFYNSDFPPSSPRYSFPGMLAVPLLGLLAFTTLFTALEMAGFNQFISKQTTNALFAALFLLIVVDGYQEAKAYVQNNVATTNAFSDQMTSYYNHLAKHPEEPIVFDSYSVWNVEPIASLRAYLLANDIKNPMYLRLNFPPVTEPSPDLVAYRIYGFLDHISKNGGCGFTGAEYAFLSGGECIQWGFQPMTKLSGEYFAIKIDEQNKVSGSVKPRQVSEAR